MHNEKDEGRGLPGTGVHRPSVAPEKLDLNLPLPTPAGCSSVGVPPADAGLLSAPPVALPTKYIVRSVLKIRYVERTWFY